MSEDRKNLRVEPEHQGTAWNHPYLIYVALTAALFGFLLVMGYLAKTNGWIPDRGIRATELK